MRVFHSLAGAGAALACAALVAGCESSYIYRPTEHATSQLPENGLPAALYGVPADQPRGEVKVAALGVFHPENQEGERLALRLVVTNNSDEPWVVVAPEQTLVIAGAARGPEYASGMPKGATAADVPPRSQRSFDLFFILPASSDESPPEFQLAWGIRMPGRYVTDRTSFRKEEVTDPYGYGAGYAYGYYGFGYGYPYYWPGAYPYAWPYGRVSGGGRPHLYGSPPPVRIGAPPPGGGFRVAPPPARHR